MGEAGASPRIISAVACGAGPRSLANRSAEDVRAAREEAEGEMWAWYLEWSTIARTTISDGRLLQRLGFGTRRARAAASEEPEAADTDVDGGGDGEPGWHRDAHEHPVVDPT